MQMDTRNSHVHPAIASILNGFLDQHEKLLRAEYVTALRTMDWQAEFSDDNSIVQAARKQMQRIRELQPVVDQDLSMFNAHRPAVHGAPSI